jgi:hypothetical protein
MSMPVSNAMVHATSKATTNGAQFHGCSVPHLVCSDTIVAELVSSTPHLACACNGACASLGHCRASQLTGHGVMHGFVVTSGHSAKDNSTMLHAACCC